jgi:hypothetical protein
VGPEHANGLMRKKEFEKQLREENEGNNVFAVKNPTNRKQQ